MARTQQQQQQQATAAIVMMLAVQGLALAQAQQQQPTPGNANFVQTLFMDAGKTMVERQLHRALFVGHHMQRGGLMPNYTSSDLQAAQWDPILIPRSYIAINARANNAEPTAMPENVLLLRRPKQQRSRVRRDGCHVLFFHGNAVNVGMILDSLAAFERHLQCHIYAIEYGGYRQDDTHFSPSEELITGDALAATNWLLAEAGPNDDVFLFGHSLGAALAVDVAAKIRAEGNDEDAAADHENAKKLAGLILESPFLSAIRTAMDYKNDAAFGNRLADSSIPELSRNFLEPLDQFKNEEKIGQIDTDLPLFVAHATNDKVVPFTHGQKIFESFGGEQKSAVFLESDSHTLHNSSDASSGPFFSALDSFIQDVTERNEDARKSDRPSAAELLEEMRRHVDEQLEIRSVGGARANSVTGGSPFSWEDQGSVAPAQRSERREWSQWDQFLSDLASDQNAKPGRLDEAALEEGDPFGIISVTRADQVEYDPSTNAETTNIVVEITGTSSQILSGGEILAIQSSRPVRRVVRGPQRRSVPEIRQGGLSYNSRLMIYEGCTFTTEIGRRVTLLGTFQPGQAVLLPAKRCRVVSRNERLRPLLQPQQLWQEEHEEHEEHEECEEFKYQFLDQDACSLSRPLNAMDAL